MSEEPKPIVDAHIEFARELVALARKHGANRLDLTFDLSSSRNFFEHRSNWQRVRLCWSEGRHGAKSRISLSADVKAEFTEEVE
jgi:hypothetical protein